MRLIASLWLFYAPAILLFFGAVALTLTLGLALESSAVSSVALGAVTVEGIILAVVAFHLVSQESVVRQLQRSSEARAVADLRDLEKAIEDLKVHGAASDYAVQQLSDFVEGLKNVRPLPSEGELSSPVANLFRAAGEYYEEEQKKVQSELRKLAPLLTPTREGFDVQRAQARQQQFLTASRDMEQTYERWLEAQEQFKALGKRIAEERLVAARLRSDLELIRRDWRPVFVMVVVVTYALVLAAVSRMQSDLGSVLEKMNIAVIVVLVYAVAVTMWSAVSILKARQTRG